MNAMFRPTSDSMLVRDNKASNKILGELGQLVRTTTVGAALTVGPKARLYAKVGNVREVSFWMDCEMDAEKFNRVEALLMHLGDYCVYGYVVKCRGENGEEGFFAIGPNEDSKATATSQFHAAEALDIMRSDDVQMGDILEVIKELADYLNSRRDQ